jgi:hypothetical protein
MKAPGDFDRPSSAFSAVATLVAETLKERRQTMSVSLCRSAGGGGMSELNISNNPTGYGLQTIFRVLAKTVPAVNQTLTVCCISTTNFTGT